MEYTYVDECFSDLFKDVNGWRPRGFLMDDWNGRTPRQKQELWNALCDELAENQKREQKLLEERIAEFENRVQDTIKLGAGDRLTALRWLTQVEEFYNPQCVEHWVWNQGILFSDYGRKLCNELYEIVTYKEEMYNVA
tara:strand:- start:210 stop:623 length:414 start_codon:yes stop_codon:yes gene_type:complete